MWEWCMQYIIWEWCSWNVAVQSRDANVVKIKTLHILIETPLNAQLIIYRRENTRTYTTPKEKQNQRKNFNLATLPAKEQTKIEGSNKKEQIIKSFFTVQSRGKEKLRKEHQIKRNEYLI